MKAEQVFTPAQRIFGAAEIGETHSVPAGNRRRLLTRKASEVEAQQVEWWVDDWIPADMLTLLTGREGLGKSMLSVMLAAEASRDGHPVLYLASEDSIEHVVRPRLEAAGADLDRVILVQGELVAGEGEVGGSLTLPRDFDLLREAVADHGVRFMVMDAAKSFLDPELNGYNERDLRTFLEPLSKLATDQACTTLALVHMGKDESKDMVARIAGSAAWGQVARSVLGMVDYPDRGGVLVTNVKRNLAPRKRSQIGKVTPAQLEIGGHTVDVGRFEWIGDSDVHADEVTPEKKRAAEEEKDPKYGDTTLALVQALTEIGPAKAAQLVEHTGLSRGTASGALARGRGYGLFTYQDTHGTYGLTDAGRGVFDALAARAAAAPVPSAANAAMQQPTIEED